MKKRFTISGWITAAAALAFFLTAVCPYALLKSIGDRFASDGDLERLTPEFAGMIHIIAAVCFAVCAGVLVWMIWSPDSFARFRKSVAALPKRCLQDIPIFFSDLKNAVTSTGKLSLGLMILFTAAGTILRIIKINTPLLHDEAYSMAIWGRSDLLFAISDYHLPNNHVFHSFLINLVYHHLGKSPALLRLPVCLSGCLLIPAVWLLGKLVYDNKVGTAAAGLTAFSPFLIFYSVNARGYELQALLSVLTVGLAVYGKRKPNIFTWLLLILLSALNFFTLPIALYPFGGICVWLFLNVIFFRNNNSGFRSGWQLFKYLITAGLCVSALSMLLYVPLLRYSGWDSFFGNIYIGGTESSTFGQTMISRFWDNLHAFTDTLPLPVTVCIAIGLLLAPFAFRKTSGEKVSYGAALLLWMGLLIPFQKPNLWPRTLLFLHPFILLFAASGLSCLRFFRGGRKVLFCLYGLLILGAGISQFSPAIQEFGVVGTDEQAVRLIIEREGANAGNIHFVTAAQDNAPLWIYSDAYGLPKKIFDKREAFNTVYALVNPLNDSYLGPQDLDDLLARFGPGDNFIARDRFEILMEKPDGILYRFETHESAVLKGYGEFPAFPSVNE